MQELDREYVEFDFAEMMRQYTINATEFKRRLGLSKNDIAKIKKEKRVPIDIYIQLAEIYPNLFPKSLIA